MITACQRSLFCALMLLIGMSAEIANGDEMTKEVQRLPLWNGKSPIGDGQFEATEVYVTVYRPAKPRRSNFPRPGPYSSVVRIGKRIVAWCI